MRGISIRNKEHLVRIGYTHLRESEAETEACRTGIDDRPRAVTDIWDIVERLRTSNRYGTIWHRPAEGHLRGEGKAELKWNRVLRARQRKRIDHSGDAKGLRGARLRHARWRRQLDGIIRTHWKSSPVDVWRR